MKAAFIGAGAALLTIAGTASAQELPAAPVTETPVTQTTVTTATPTANGNGAAVTNTETTSTTTTPNADGTNSTVTATAHQHAVTTPSGNTTTVTREIDAMGARTKTVERTKATTGDKKKPR